MVIRTIQLPLSNALDMQERAVVNSTNLITEWIDDSVITTYALPGTVVYTYENTEYVLWRRTATTMGFDQTVPPYMDNGTFWEEISLGGGSLTIGDLPPTNPAPDHGDLWLESTTGVTLYGT